MPQSNYQEPIEKKNADLEKKMAETNIEIEKKDSVKKPEEATKKEIIPVPEIAEEGKAEIATEVQEEKISEKIETARKTISKQKGQPVAKVSDDAQIVAQIQEFEKKVERLVEIAMQKGPEHAIRVAQHMDKGKIPIQADNYTLDEVHDRLMEDEVRAQLIQ